MASYQYEETEKLIEAVVKESSQHPELTKIEIPFNVIAACNHKDFYSSPYSMDGEYSSVDVRTQTITYTAETKEYIEKMKLVAREVEQFRPKWRVKLICKRNKGDSPYYYSSEYNTFQITHRYPFF